MTAARPLCLLIADTRHELFPLVAAQWAALRGLKCLQWDTAEAGFVSDGLGPNVLLALSYRTLSSLSTRGLLAVKAAVWQGATLYVRGGFPTHSRCSFSPFGSGAFGISSCRADGYLLADHWLLPEVLRNETVKAEVNLVVAQLGDCAAQVLAAIPGGGGQLAFVLAMQCGAGVVIYDLLPDQVPAGTETPIVRRLAAPAARCFELGALAAVNHAIGRPGTMLGAYNLVLDDRPRDFDYFNVARLTRWLDHLDAVCPGVHIDFGWTPQYAHPSARYIEALKRFNAGFVWHGLHRHVDHGQVPDPAAVHMDGLKLVREITERYAVRFQPIMILPFERLNPEVLLYLPKAGFKGAVFDVGSQPGLQNQLPGYMHQSTPLHDLYIDYLPALRRYLVPGLTRDLMLANAALDLPIIASAHPLQVGLRRWSALYNPLAAVSSHFDQVLRFAREKRLRPLSLEQIAAEMISYPRPAQEVMAFCSSLREIDVAV